MELTRISRRRLLRTGMGLTLGGIVGPYHRIAAETGAQPATREARLTARASTAALLGNGGPKTDVWCYNDRVPGPVLRYQPGERARIVLENQLDQPTTIHWHGLRVPNAMDGVPDLTQPAVAPGGRFTYEFELRDSGTYWYHPHYQSAEQLGRGLHGVVIVEDETPIKVDEEITWVLDDWRLTGQGAISDDFGNLHDASHAGRIGNTATINGEVPGRLSVQAGERIRLRLVNVANAWIFGLSFLGHRPRIIALDGHPVTPYEPDDGIVVLGPSMRADIVIDMVGKPGESFDVLDRFFPQRPYKLLDLVYGAEAPLRESPLDAAIDLAPHRLPEPSVTDARRHNVTLGGGAMGGMPDALLDGQRLGLRELAGRGKVWAINGVVASGHRMDPLLRFKLAESYVLSLRNETAFHHPIHLHGHPFRIISRNGKPEPRRPWRDTVLTAPRERVDVALVADNPGKWMFHCHIPEHQEAGMMAIVEVA